MSTPATTTTRANTGHGNPSSLSCRRVSANRFSIVDRLAALSVSGLGLQILVHQHFGYRLHLEWSGNGSRHRDSSRFMERGFYLFSEAESFCTELCDQGLDGLCTCVYEGHNINRHERAPTCRRAPFYPSQKYLLLPKWPLNHMEDAAVETLCDCDITSSDAEPIHWT